MPQEPVQHKELFPKTVVLLSFASFFNDIASEVLLKGALPIYLVSVLGAPMVAVGFIDGAAELVSTLLQTASGWWADKTGRRKPFVLAGYTLSNVTKPLLLFAANWWQVLAIRLTDRVGKGLRGPPRDAMIAEATPSQERGRAFGLNRALDPAGAMFSLLGGAWIISRMHHPIGTLDHATFKNLVIFILGPAIAAVLLVAIVREKRSTPVNVTSSMRIPGLPRPFWWFLGINILFSLGNSTDSFLILRAWNLKMPLPSIFLMLAALNLMSVIFSLPAGILSDKLGRKRFLAAGWVLYAMVYSGFGFAHYSWQIWPLLLLYGVYYGLTEGISKALVADLVPADRRATAYGILSTAQGLSVLPAGLLAGWLWSTLSPATPFLLGGILSLLATMGLVFLPANKAVY